MRTAASTEFRCAGSAISKTKRDTATRSRLVETVADRMFTWWSDSTRVTSESSRDRSIASTWIWTRNRAVVPESHSTSRIRSGWDRRAAMFAQSARCTETPSPRVTKPTISSPGTGVQHLANLVHTSETPLTTTPVSVARSRRGGAPGRVTSAASSSLPDSPPIACTRRWTTEAADAWPSPIAAYREDTSA